MPRTKPYPVERLPVSNASSGSGSASQAFQPAGWQRRARQFLASQAKVVSADEHHQVASVDNGGLDAPTFTVIEDVNRAPGRQDNPITT